MRFVHAGAPSKGLQAASESQSKSPSRRKQEKSWKQERAELRRNKLLHKWSIDDWAEDAYMPEMYLRRSRMCNAVTLLRRAESKYGDVPRTFQADSMAKYLHEIMRSGAPRAIPTAKWLDNPLQDTSEEAYVYGLLHPSHRMWREMTDNDFKDERKLSELASKLIALHERQVRQALAREQKDKENDWHESPLDPVSFHGIAEMLVSVEKKQPKTADESRSKRGKKVASAKTDPLAGFSRGRTRQLFLRVLGSAVCESFHPSNARDGQNEQSE
ncbi:hypothetical protein FVE85_8274 [Porphyridium purpureum]|uniref:Uncharacterized protein n=1 Tax=Porphyridium purpureum TaxID=35688 RepID=A0A5J4YLC9_PORPP|nr:hypothetical protein FVE85_8274 [Porphyridium purpureum]|eukprot:POR5278..scf244_11